MNLISEQLSIIESDLDTSIFLSGPAGSGKTTAGIERLIYLLQSGISGRSILLLFPQRNLSERYLESFSSLPLCGSSLPVTATYGGLARRFLTLFWPVILQNYPQLNPDLGPTFLTLESSLYFLSRIVEPLIISQGFFSTVTLQRNRLYSQILDNLNKSAVHAFPHTEIADRLISSWIGDPSQAEIYIQAQEAANSFRSYCFQNNLLDYSLQIELFTKSISDIPLIANHLFEQFDHLIYDNCEEDVPVSHDLVKALFPHLNSCLFIFDEEAGYRNFLGASPESAASLSAFCEERITFNKIFTSPLSLQSFNGKLTNRLLKRSPSREESFTKHAGAVSISFQPSYPEMVDWVAMKAHSLIESGVLPGQIVILAPFVSDSLRFLLRNSLDRAKVPSSSHRPSRALRDEPAVQALLTLAALAHPAWEIKPTVYEIALCLMEAFSDLDLTRAHLLASQAVKNSPAGKILLADFDSIPTKYQDRITFSFGALYQELLDWLKTYDSGRALPIDHFLTHLFGDLLCRPGFGFHSNLIKGRAAAQIIESTNKFRLSAGIVLGLDQAEIGKEYYRMVKTGLLANQYIKSWTEHLDNEILIAPAYTFLLKNSPVDYQFWLDIGSRGWYERIYQPLTNPHILSREWQVGELWDDDEEQDHNLNSLICLTTGLIRRCRNSIFCTLSEVDERGFEQKGLLLTAMNGILSDNFSTNNQKEF